ncbi:hypothetical protein LPJ66_002831 [Kickxella alabastrina]|uniref:Uncharacterized protein n=1 Tax=Kickxella alabastrina TaxID=61397 RepID=A0ACC1IPD5_9FUNG|nr:hypothetical protein LPJ66_002831 [Kickxella alabastrina]
MSPTIILPTGEPYHLNGFLSLSNKQALTLRTTGFAAAKQTHGAAYIAPQWNPTIDVLAVPEGKTLRLVRLSGGQTIWRRTLSDQFQTSSAGGSDRQLNDGQTIRAIAWHPDGSRIVVLHANGLLAHRDTECGDIVHESAIPLGLGDLVTSMQWISCNDVGEQRVLADLANLQLEFFLPRLSQLDKSKSAPSDITPTAEPLTAIVVTASTGAVCISLGGIFTLPVIQLPATKLSALMRGGSTYTAISAQLGTCASELFIMLSSAGIGDRNSEIIVHKLDTSILTSSPSSSPLLHNLVAVSARLSSLFLYLENTRATMVREFEARETSASRASLVQLFERVLQDHGVEEATNPAAELIRLAVTGRASESTAQFLLAKLKASKLANWESAGRLGAVMITRLVYQHALPAVERALLATTQLLKLTLSESPSSNCPGAGQAATTRDCIMRAVVIFGWLYGRFEEFMAKVGDEQRENQEFVDWALFSIDDLNWQNDGSRRIGHEDADADDGSRPVRPEIDYKLLLRFIRTAFCCHSTASDFETEEKPLRELATVLTCDSEGQVGQRSALVQSYFDLLVENAHIQGLDFDRIAGQKPGVQRQNDNRHNLFAYVFHSQQLLESAIERSGVSGVAPTCQEALVTAKSLIAQALEWPSRMLGEGLQWAEAPAARYLPAVEQTADIAGRITDSHQVSSADGNMIFMATVAVSAARTQILEIVSIPADNMLARPAEVSAVELAVKTVELAELATPINVSGLSFFDDNLLGLSFTIDGCDSTFLGAIEYRPGSGMVHYHTASFDGTACDIRAIAKSTLTFARLSELSAASSRFPTALATNGRKGRRCVAVIEQRGKFWWPYDMDNSEDEGEEDEDEDL